MLETVLIEKEVEEDAELNEIAEAITAAANTAIESIKEKVLDEDEKESWNELAVAAESPYTAVNYWLSKEESSIGSNYYRKDESEEDNVVKGAYVYDANEVANEVIDEIVEVKQARMLGMNPGTLTMDRMKKEALEVYKLFDQTFTFVMYEIVR